MKVLVTGANGFVGKTICDYLERLDVEILRLFSPNSLKNRVGSNRQDLYVDITDNKALTAINVDKIKNIDTIIHTAGLAHQFGVGSIDKFWKVNVKGTENVCKFAKRIKAGHFIQISSVSVYGDIPEKQSGSAITEDSVCNPETFYAQSKLEAEKTCQRILEQTEDIKLTILRLATVIGEGDAGNVLRLIKAIDNRQFVWIGTGRNLKSLIYKEDVAKIIYKLLDREGFNYEIYNISAEPKSMYEIVSTIGEALGRKILPVTIPYILAKKTLRTTNKLVRSNKLFQIEKSLAKWITNDCYSGERIRNKLDITSNTLIIEALKKEVIWYKSQKC